MVVRVNGAGSITGLEAGGLPDNSITTAEIADAAVTAAKLSTGAPSWTSGGVLSFNSGYGSVATAYGVRAWVNFDGTSGSIGSGRANGNVSSVTDNGSGDYTVNFSTALSDANYCAFGSVIGSSNTDATDAFVSAGFNAATATHTTSAFRFTTAHRTQGAQDYNQVQVAVIR